MCIDKKQQQQQQKQNWTETMPYLIVVKSYVLNRKFQLLAVLSCKTPNTGKWYTSSRGITCIPEIFPTCRGVFSLTYIYFLTSNLHALNKEFIIIIMLWYLFRVAIFYRNVYMYEPKCWCSWHFYVEFRYKFHIWLSWSPPAPLRSFLCLFF